MFFNHLLKYINLVNQLVSNNYITYKIWVNRPVSSLEKPILQREEPMYAIRFYLYLNILADLNKGGHCCPGFCLSDPAHASQH